jgi:DNA-binding MarR family transcriptional regulator
VSGGGDVLGNVGRKGMRLTRLADRAQLGLAACSELVNDLERLQYVERRPDPSDGRAKLIVRTARRAPAGAGVQA